MHGVAVAIYLSVCCCCTLASAPDRKPSGARMEQGAGRNRDPAEAAPANVSAPGGTTAVAPQAPRSSTPRKRGQLQEAVLKVRGKPGGRNPERAAGGGRLQLAAVAEVSAGKRGLGSPSAKKVTKRPAVLRKAQEAERRAEGNAEEKAEEAKGSAPRAKPTVRAVTGATEEAKAGRMEKEQLKAKREGDGDEDERGGRDDEEGKKEAGGGKATPPPPPARFPGGQTLNSSSFMESLPAGCLLSDSLIACGSVGMAHLPIITDLGVTALYLADNRIGKLPFRGLAGLPNLEWLDLSKNKLDDSSLSASIFRNLTRLRRLNLDGNGLTKIPLLPASLVELKINDNKIRSLTAHSFKGLSKLLTLELEGNGLHDGNVSPLSLRPLRAILYLRLGRNKFRGIPSGLPPSIQELHLSENRVEEVREGVLNKALRLRALDLSRNRVREDRIAPRAWVHLPKLEALDLSYNKLVHVPSFLPVGLRRLTLHHNQIERIPGYVFGHLRPGLESLHLSHNRLADDGVHGVSFLGLYRSLVELLLDHNQLGSVPRGLLLLRTLQLIRLNDNFIRYVPLDSICDTRVSVDSPLVSVHLENNLIDRHLIPPTAFSCIRTYHSVLLRPQRHEEEQEE